MATVAPSTSTAFGVGVLATGWHRPSDSVAAYLVCVIMFCLATAALLRWTGAGDEEMGTVEERLTPAADGRLEWDLLGPSTRRGPWRWFRSG